MKLTIERGALLKALGHVQSAVERRWTLAILNNILLVAEAGALTMAGTDMDLEIRESVPAQIAADGKTTVPAGTLYDIARKLPAGCQVELELLGKKNQVALRAGRSIFNLMTAAAEFYPVLSAGEMTHTFSLPAADLRRLVERTRFAMSTEEVRYYLNGIYLHAPDNQKLRAVSTDGHRLARVDIALPEGAAGMPGVIVPRKTVIELGKLLADAEGDVTIAVRKEKIQVTVGNAVLTSKLLDGTFPDYGRAIPVNNDRVLQVSHEELTSAVDRVATISHERTRVIKLSISVGSLTVSSSNAEGGVATEEVDARYDREAIEIGFNSRYLLDITGEIDGDTVEFALNDAGSPTLVRAVGDPSALFVIMPMRV